MFKLVVAFTDGSVNEFLCETREGANAYLKKLEHVFQWEIVPL
jgi:hypothetical protein